MRNELFSHSTKYYFSTKSALYLKPTLIYTLRPIAELHVLATIFSRSNLPCVEHTRFMLEVSSFIIPKTNHGFWKVLSNIKNQV